MSVSFKELAGSPTEEYGPDGMRAQRVLLCAWGDREALITEALGDGYIFGGTGQAQYPGKSQVWVVRAHCEPFTDDVTPQVLSDLQTGLNVYDSLCKVTLNYEAMDLPQGKDIEDIQIESETFLTYRVAGSAEATAVSSMGMFWKSDLQPVRQDESYLIERIPNVEHHLTWHRVLYPPMVAIRANVGRVNGVLWHGFAPETLLFDTWSLDREWVVTSELETFVVSYSLQYIFRERIVPLGDGGIAGWNHTFRTEPFAKMGWDVKLQFDGATPYPPSSTFDDLFRYAATQ